MPKDISEVTKRKRSCILIDGQKGVWMMQMVIINIADPAVWRFPAVLQTDVDSISSFFLVCD